jgi:hypothetical protein
VLLDLFSALTDMPRKSKEHREAPSKEGGGGGHALGGGGFIARHRREAHRGIAGGAPLAEKAAIRGNVAGVPLAGKLTRTPSCVSLRPHPLVA